MLKHNPSRLEPYALTRLGLIFRMPRMVRSVGEEVSYGLLSLLHAKFVMGWGCRERVSLMLLFAIVQTPQMADTCLVNIRVVKYSL